jgi:GNAT superfamily N-acetyltransferase
MSDLSIRIAREEDIPLILQLIRELAEYERMPADVTATEEILRGSLFVEKSAEVLLAYWKGQPAGFAVYFHNFSTFVGKRGLYLEDLYVKPELRSKGIGKKLLVHLAGLAKERDCGRFEWAVLDWNEPAIRFYKSLGAAPQDQWTVFRLTREQIETLEKAE